MQNKFNNRDLSWLSFNERVLQEAENESLPLYERLKFLAIFSSNLDEFYRVRVSELRHFKNFQKNSKLKILEKPKRLIKSIQKTVNSLQVRFGKTYSESIIPSLKLENIHLIHKNDYTKEQLQFVKQFFKEDVASYVKIYNLDTDVSPVLLKDKGLFLFLDIDENILVSIPTDETSRFVLLPSNDESFQLTYLDEIIRANLSEINSDFKNAKSYAVKITRDAELYFNEYDGEVVDLIKKNLQQRDTGIPTRLLYDNNMPKSLLKRLRKRLDLTKTDLMPGGKYHNFSDFFNFPKPENKPLLTFAEQPPNIHPDLELAPSLINLIKNKDVLLSYPYQKFDYLPQMILEAADTEDIHSIHITFYRVSKNSDIAKALLKCLKKGKKVTVFIEAKARFDEENNIYWGEKLTKNGAKVLYSMPKIKVHSKIFLLEANHYKLAYIGTGNLNENSAKIYADFGLLTTNNTITSEIKQVFTFLNNPFDFKPDVKTILMSPFTMRSSIYDKIDREITLAKSNKKGLLYFKMNSLEDEAIINKLYEASQAGVEIKLIVRGMFKLLPQIENLSENIHAISVVGRYLEHSRIYWFGNDGNEEIYIASADCMTRNLDKRVEVGVPILDKTLKAVLKKCINLQWNDNVKARILDAEETNTYQINSKPKINSQNDFYDFFKVK